LIASQKAEIERLKKIVEQEAEEARIIRLEAEALAEEEQAAKWADEELDRLEAVGPNEITVEVLPPVDAIIEELEDGRVKLTIPVNQR
jgi:hypothetical protein